MVSTKIAAMASSLAVLAAPGYTPSKVTPTPEGQKTSAVEYQRTYGKPVYNPLTTLDSQNNSIFGGGLFEHPLTAMDMSSRIPEFRLGVSSLSSPAFTFTSFAGQPDARMTSDLMQSYTSAPSPATILPIGIAIGAGLMRRRRD